MSRSEAGPTPRGLSGTFWQHFQVQKVLYGVWPDGTRRVPLLLVATAIGIYSSWTVLRCVRRREKYITALHHCHYYPPTCYRHSAMFNIATHLAMITMATHLRHGQHCNLSARSGSLAGARDPPRALDEPGPGHVPVRGPDPGPHRPLQEGPGGGGGQRFPSPFSGVAASATSGLATCCSSSASLLASGLATA